MRTPIGRVNKLSILLLLVLAAAVAAGLIVPGGTGTAIEVAAWLAIAFLLLLEFGMRTTPVMGNYYGDEEAARGNPARERAEPTDPQDEGRNRKGPPSGGSGIGEPPPFNR